MHFFLGALRVNRLFSENDMIEGRFYMPTHNTRVFCVSFMLEKCNCLIYLNRFDKACMMFMIYFSHVYKILGHSVSMF